MVVMSSYPLATIDPSLKPINTAIEHYLVKKIIRKKRSDLEKEEGFLRNFNQQ
jgi:hypothetical protein